MLAKCLVHVRQQSVVVVVAATLGSGAELQPEAPSLQLVLRGQIIRPSLNYRFVSSGYLLAVWDFADLGALIVSFFFFGGTCQQLILQDSPCSSLPSPFSLLVAGAGLPGSQLHSTLVSKAPLDLPPSLVPGALTQASLGSY